jgi:transcriptional regulator with XRE-family HTH domain
MEINGKEIYERIIQTIKNRGIKNIDLYKKLGITRQHLARWKNGSLPSIDILYAIKEELNVSLDWLITGKNNQDATDPAAPFQIVNRIDYYLEDKTKRKKYEDNFYSSIDDIVKPYDLADWLNSRQELDISKVVKIADRLGASVQYFITGSQISKSEYTEKYFGNRETEDADFYRKFSCLDTDKRKEAKHIVDLLFNEQYEKK